MQEPGCLQLMPLTQQIPEQRHPAAPHAHVTHPISLLLSVVRSCTQLSTKLPLHGNDYTVDCVFDCCSGDCGFRVYC